MIWCHPMMTKALMISLICSLVACCAAIANSPTAEWGVGRPTAVAPSCYPPIPVHDTQYYGKVVDGWDSEDADPLFDQLNESIDKLYAQRHRGKKLGAQNDGHKATVTFTIVRKTKQITAVKFDKGLSNSSEFGAEMMDLLKQVRLPKTWSPKGPDVIDVCYTTYSGKESSGTQADSKQPADSTGSGVISARLVRVKRLEK